MLKTVMIRSALMVLACSLSLSAYAMADDVKRAIHVPAGDLAVALELLARQSGTDLVYRPDQVQGLKTRGVDGELSVEQAVTKLLEGTPLTLSTDSTGAMLIAAPLPPAAPAVDSAPASPSADASPAVNRSFLDRLRLAQADNTSSAPREGRGIGENDQASSRKPVVLEEVVVTGTHIRGVAPVGSPLDVYDRQAIQRSGAGTVEQFVRTIPQNFSLISADTVVNNPRDAQAGTNQSRGAGINLRGLGSGSTLVLLDGHRMAPAGSDGSFADISMIPLSVVEYVEVLPDGASAIYGSDSVAGVVNFVLRRDFDGAETSLRYGATSDGGERERIASQVFGHSWERGNFIATYDYHDRSGLRADQRSYVPDQGGLFQILPVQRSQGGFVSGHHEPRPGLDLRGNTFFSARRFVQDTNQLGIGALHADGESRQYGGAGGFSLMLPRDWNLVLDGSYSKQNGHQQAVQTGFESSLHSWSSVISGDLRGDGALFQIPGGDVRASIGFAHRSEEFGAQSTGGAHLRRNVHGPYAELSVPVIGEANAKRAASELELSLSARSDHYSDFGSSTNPKLGIRWVPVGGLTLRGTYSKSFRAPFLSQVAPGAPPFSYLVFPLPNSASPTLSTNTLVEAPPSNPDLRPERSTSFTAGLDIEPGALPGLSISGTYFNIDYKNRISIPPLLGGSVFGLFDQLDALGPFVDLAPDPARVHAIFLENDVFDATGEGEAGVQATFNSRPQNIARSEVSGVDLAVSYDTKTALGDATFFVAGTRMFKLDYQALSSTAAVELLDVVYEPTSLRLRGGVNFSRGPFSASATVTHANDYDNDLVSPARDVSSWTTADLQFGYRIAADRRAPLGGTTLTLSVLNVANKAPPFVASDNPFVNFGFDATNASPLGRVVAFQLTQRW